VDSSSADAAGSATQRVATEQQQVRRKNKASRDIHAAALATGERGGRVDPQEFPPKLAMTTPTPTPTPMNETSDAVQLTTRPDESPKA
jgi:hypothetical protein